MLPLNHSRSAVSKHVVFIKIHLAKITLPLSFRSFYVIRGVFFCLFDHQVENIFVHSIFSTPLSGFQVDLIFWLRLPPWVIGTSLGRHWAYKNVMVFDTSQSVVFLETVVQVRGLNIARETSEVQLHLLIDDFHLFFSYWNIGAHSLLSTSISGDLHLISLLIVIFTWFFWNTLFPVKFCERSLRFRRALSVIHRLLLFRWRECSWQKLFWLHIYKNSLTELIYL